jgi:hypothetical protein
MNINLFKIMHVFGLAYFCRSSSSTSESDIAVKMRSNYLLLHKNRNLERSHPQSLDKKKNE